MTHPPTFKRAGGRHAHIETRMAAGVCVRPDCTEPVDDVDERNVLCAQHYLDGIAAARAKGRTCAFGFDHWDAARCCDCGAARPQGETAGAGLYRCQACIAEAVRREGESVTARLQAEAARDGTATPRWRKGQNVKLGEAVCKFCDERIDWRRNPAGRRYPAVHGGRPPHRCRTARRAS